MAFSFNWAGLQAPQVSLGQEADLDAVGANLGKALRGYRNREAAEEYADKIKQYRMGRNASDAGRADRISQIKQEIARLETENAQLKEAMAASVPQVNEEDYVPYGTMEAWLFDPNNTNEEEIRSVQNTIWGDNSNEVDGKWGPRSTAQLAKWKLENPAPKYW